MGSWVLTHGTGSPGSSDFDCYFTLCKRCANAQYNRDNLYSVQIVSKSKSQKNTYRQEEKNSDSSPISTTHNAHTLTSTPTHATDTHPHHPRHPRLPEKTH